LIKGKASSVLPSEDSGPFCVSWKRHRPVRKLFVAGYYRGLQHFEYFIVGVSLALCAYVGQTLHPEKLTFLSAYTIQVASLALLILSAGVGLKRIESLVQISRLNG
jgi:hypothetical protein